MVHPKLEQTIKHPHNRRAELAHSGNIGEMIAQTGERRYRQEERPVRSAGLWRIWTEEREVVVIAWSAAPTLVDE
jgi:hypothetical protein